MTYTPRKCDLCEHQLCFQWTDTHGVAVCTNCGLPYTLYHYHPETKERLDLEPSIALDAAGIEIAKRYWAETQQRVFAGCYDFTGTHNRRGGTTYSGATQQEMNAFDDWYKAECQAGRVPNPPADEEQES